MTKEFAIAFMMMAASIGPAIAIGWMASAAFNAVSRNPEAADKIMGNFLLPLALAEAIAIYSLVVALVLKFVA